MYVYYTNTKHVHYSGMSSIIRWSPWFRGESRGFEHLSGRWGDPKKPYDGKKGNPGWVLSSIPGLNPSEPGFMYDFVARVGGPDRSPAGP